MQGQNSKGDTTPYARNDAAIRVSARGMSRPVGGEDGGGIESSWGHIKEERKSVVFLNRD